jgi:hypothetical protein
LGQQHVGGGEEERRAALFERTAVSLDVVQNNPDDLRQRLRALAGEEFGDGVYRQAGLQRGQDALAVEAIDGPRSPAQPTARRDCARWA